jgi:hypothetical protein
MLKWVERSWNRGGFRLINLKKDTKTPPAFAHTLCKEKKMEDDLSLASHRE